MGTKRPTIRNEPRPRGTAISPAVARGARADPELTDADAGTDGAIERAEDDDAVIPQRFENPSNDRSHRRTTSPELRDATDSDLDAVVAGVGTGGTITATGERYLSTDLCETDRR